MRLYLAGPFECRADIATIGLALTRDGHEITSRWLTEHNTARTIHEERAQASTDLADIMAAEALVLCSEWPGSERGGRHFETGYAYALGKTVIVLGRRRNVFHSLGRVKHYGTLDRLRLDLRRS